MNSRRQLPLTGLLVRATASSSANPGGRRSTLSITGQHDSGASAGSGAKSAGQGHDREAARGRVKLAAGDPNEPSAPRWMATNPRLPCRGGI
jgi:hypothetical protein